MEFLLPLYIFGSRYLITVNLLKLINGYGFFSFLFIYNLNISYSYYVSFIRKMYNIIINIIIFDFSEKFKLIFGGFFNIH